MTVKIPVHKQQWVQPTFAYENYDLSVNSIQARLHNYNTDRFYKRRTKDSGFAKIDIGYLLYIRELRLLGHEIAQQLIYILTDYYGRRPLSFMLVEFSDIVSRHGWYEYMRRSAFNSINHHGLGHLRISENNFIFIDIACTILEKLINEKSFDNYLDITMESIISLRKLSSVLKEEYDNIGYKSSSRTGGVGRYNVSKMQDNK